MMAWLGMEWNTDETVLSFLLDFYVRVCWKLFQVLASLKGTYRLWESLMGSFSYAAEVGTFSDILRCWLYFEDSHWFAVGNQPSKDHSPQRRCLVSCQYNLEYQGAFGSCLVSVGFCPRDRRFLLLCGQSGSCPGQTEFAHQARLCQLFQTVQYIFGTEWLGKCSALTEHVKWTLA